MYVFKLNEKYKTTEKTTKCNFKKMYEAMWYKYSGMLNLSLHYNGDNTDHG